ncbi:DUF1542 domain-containing protein [Staphylococcus saccharolyticus]|uniref:DUF1542 domain-containing protein n=1 Tax=Staphylococcus saccharolyticus TaxID=33028 RepID=UPI0010D73032|nr:DUF1542 domain-containing protein [Staphylococcus saccharolyticus]TAA94062.1 hypothetical protein DMB74_05570 [Staphylococcus saccharolyticus]TAA95028.1 hypothetical protein DMB77_05570 [Staphylococcus saccharolyticus]
MHALNQLDQLHETAKNSVNQAQSNQQVETAQLNGLEQSLDEETKKIIALINDANTDNDVDNAKNNGLNSIKQYSPEYNKKKNAILKLYDVSDAQEAIMQAYPYATEEESNKKLLID